MTIATRFTALLIALVLVAGGLGGVAVNQAATSALLAREMEALNGQARLRGQRLVAGVEALRDDVRFLGATPPIQGLVRSAADGVDPLDGSEEAAWRDRLASIFREMLKAKGSYLQAAYVGVADGGRELVRVDRFGERQVTAEALERQGEATWFVETLQLAPGEVFLSEIELAANERVLRAAVPVFSGEREVFGAVVLTLDIGASLEALERSLPVTHTAYVVNDAGHYLLHPDRTKTFTWTDDPDAERLQDGHPATGDFFTSTSRERRLSVVTGTEPGDAAMSLAKVAFDPRAPGRYVAVAVHRDYEEIAAQVSEVRNRGLLLLAALLFGAGTLAVLLSRALSHRLRLMSVAADRIAAGDQDVDLPLGGNDELSTLAEALHVMDRRIAERTDALFEAEERMRAIVNAAPNGILTLSPEGRLAGCNPAGARLFGRTEEELTGARVVELLRHDDRERFLAWTDEVRGGAGEAGVHRFTAVRADGAELATQWRVGVVHTPSGSLIVAVVSDLSDELAAEEERRAFEQRMQQSQKLESLGQLAGGVAHDFNNLLVGIRLNAGHVRMLVDDDEADEALGDVVAAADRAAELCHQMLTYAGRGELELEPLDPNRLVGEIARLVSGSLPSKVRVSQHLPPELPAVDGDASQLGQVVMNLLLNAGESYEGQPGLVAVRTGVCEVEATDLERALGGQELAPGRYVFIEVEDGGCGMAPETLARIFDPFFTTKFTGRGLGLAAGLGIVRRHGGALLVQSDEGVGTTFRLLLPPGRGAASAAFAPAPASCPAVRRRLLVVDDDRTVLRAVRAVAEHAGYEVATAHSGECATCEVRDCMPRGFDLVLLDVTMPEMDGVEVLEVLKGLDADLPVVMMSGYTVEELPAEARARLHGFLHKPFGPEELLAAFDRAVGAEAKATGA